MASSSEAVAAASADDVSFARDERAKRNVIDVGADFDDLADELVADREAKLDCLLGPRVPIVNVQIGSADSGKQHANFDIVDANLGFGNIL
jgi:hypothetical protein